MLLGEETSGNHQAYRRGHLDITISQRNRLMLLMCMAGLSQQQRPQLKRRAWVWPRQQIWFCLLIAHTALHFRVTHETFEYLCDIVTADLQKPSTDADASAD